MPPKAGCIRHVIANGAGGMTHFGGRKSAALSHADQLLHGVDEHGCWALVHASKELRKDPEFFLHAAPRCLRAPFERSSGADSLKIFKDTALKSSEIDDMEYQRSG